MQTVVPKILTDRFWQAGISDGSKDEFYARVIDKRGTIEGLASTIRGSIRFVRETAYALIFCMSRLDLRFYGIDGLSAAVSDALFTDSIWLSTHQQASLLSVVRHLVDTCPVDHRERFLPRLLSACFHQMDAKIHGEWREMEQRQSVAVGEEAGLKEEMKAESILRQVTYTAVMMMADLLDPTKSSTSARPSHMLSRDGRLTWWWRPDPPSMSRHGQQEEAGAGNGMEQAFPPLRAFCLSHQDIVEPLLVFCTHGVRMRDTRCCGMVLRLFLSLVPEFSVPQSQEQAAPPAQGAGAGSSALSTSPVPPQLASVIREYISSEVLKDCLTSFNETYFVEVQKELASLVASIVVNYGRHTTTPRNVLLRLPNVSAEGVDRLMEYMTKPDCRPRQQRAYVLELLKDLKGVSVSEMGKLAKSTGQGSPSRGRKQQRSKMAQGFMKEAAPPGSGMAGRAGTTGDRGTTPEALEGVSGLFEG